MQIVTKDQFDAFIRSYVPELTCDVSGICEPPLVGYYDFAKAEGLEALVASYHLHLDPAKRVYRIALNAPGTEHQP